MAIEGVKSFVAANYQPAAANVKTEPVEVTVEKMESESSAINQHVEIKKVDEYSSDKNGQDSSANEQSKKQMGEEEIRQKLKDINKKINRNTVAEFGMHEGTNRITIKLKDKDTNEVIKELPPEKTLDLIEKAWELAGILVDEKR